MNEFILLSIYFLIARFSFLKAYKIFTDRANRKSFHNTIEKKIQDIAERQELLYGSIKTAKRASAFDVKNKEKLDDLLSAHHTTLDSIRMIIRQAGIKMTLSQLCSACITGGIIVSGLFIELNVLEAHLAILIGMPVGMYLIYSLLEYQASKRKQDFLKIFPDTIDMMVRGVKAGLNISRLIRLVSMETKEPIAGEFNTMLQKMELGVPYDKVFIDAANEVDIEEFRFMCVAFVLQIENGGMLADILSNLSGIVRKRLELQLKIRAMSSEARMTAIVLCALPFAFAGIMLFMNPDHLQILFKPGMGHTLLKVFCGLYFLGAVSMFKMTRMKI